MAAREQLAQRSARAHRCAASGTSTRASSCMDIRGHCEWEGHAICSYRAFKRCLGFLCSKPRRCITGCSSGPAPATLAGPLSAHVRRHEPHDSAPRLQPCLVAGFHPCFHRCVLVPRHLRRWQESVSFCCRLVGLGAWVYCNLLLVGAAGRHRTWQAQAHSRGLRGFVALPGLHHACRLPVLHEGLAQWVRCFTQVRQLPSSLGHWACCAGQVCKPGVQLAKLQGQCICVAIS